MCVRDEGQETIFRADSLFHRGSLTYFEYIYQNRAAGSQTIFRRIGQVGRTKAKWENLGSSEIRFSRLGIRRESARVDTPAMC